LPAEIKQAKEAGKLAVFVGAGFSMNFGTWSWEQLANGFIEKCYELKLFNARQRTNYHNYLKKMTLIDMITFCFKKMVESGLESEIVNLLADSCKTNPLLNGKMAESYSELRRFGDYFLTTNYDLLFDPFFASDHIQYKSSILCSTGNEGLLTKDTLYHIHGSIQELNSIILTHDQYLERYGNENYRAFLSKIMTKYTVLFIGSGVEDYIRDILRSNKRNGDTNNNFFTESVLY